VHFSSVGCHVFAGWFLFHGKVRSVFCFCLQHWVDKVACCFFQQAVIRIGQVVVVFVFLLAALGGQRSSFYLTTFSVWKRQCFFTSSSNYTSGFVDAACVFQPSNSIACT
jgi:hypothetical protein